MHSQASQCEKVIAGLLAAHTDTTSDAVLMLIATHLEC